MSINQITIPDIGTTEAVEVIEIHIAVGTKIQKDEPLITLEGEKASMEVPAPYAAVVEKVLLSVGDKVTTGDVICEIQMLQTDKQSTTPKTQEIQDKEEIVVVTLPDLGTKDAVDVIEVNVDVGSKISKDDTILTLEGEKATMEVPSPYSGEVTGVKVAVSDKVTSGKAVLEMRVKQDVSQGVAPVPPSSPKTQQPEVPPLTSSKASEAGPRNNYKAHAGPYVRRIAREFGIDLTLVTASGRKGRIVKEDLQRFVKSRLAGGATGITVAPAAEVDFAKYGEIEVQALNKIKRFTAVNVHRSWVTIPHVTHFDEADITDMEAFRQESKKSASDQNVKLTPLVFIMKALVAALGEFPMFNASLDNSGERIILKNYFHVGVAVDTPNGLVVPVIRDVDKKGIIDIAKELGDISAKARDKGLSIQDMEGSCITISSLGGIGGVGFTPIIKAPDVAILGVCKARMQPVYSHGEFVARLILPFSLSYDHRVIDGAEAARFCRYFADTIHDIRQLLL